MVASGQTCDARRLEQLLSDELSVHDESLVSRHVEECPACRTQLEELAADKTLWQETSRRLQGAEWKGDGTLWLATSDLEEGHDHESDSWILSLDFLEPSDNPSM